MKHRLALLFLLSSLTAGHAQTTLTPGVIQVPGTSSPLGLPAGPTFSTCSHACTTAFMACSSPCSDCYKRHRRNPIGLFLELCSMLFELHYSEAILHNGLQRAAI